MNNTVRVLSVLKWMCFPLGWIMYTVTRGAVGNVWSVVLATVATVAFWMIVRKEETRQMQKSIAQVIQAAILDYNRANNIVEIRRVRNGAVARVYVLGDEDTMRTLLKGMQRAVSEALQRAGLTDRVYALQLTTIGSTEDIPAKREILNKQMFKDLKAIQQQYEQRQQQDHSDKEE